MEIIRHQTAAEFLDRADAWLEKAEAENNLILGISTFFKSHWGQVKVQPYFLVVEKHGAILGAALMTPPRRLLITSMTHEGVITLADFLLAEGASLPGVLGPETEATQFADYWTSKTGRSCRRKMRERIYSCMTVIPPTYTPGRLRPASQDGGAAFRVVRSVLLRRPYRGRHRLFQSAAATQNRGPVLIPKSTDAELKRARRVGRPKTGQPQRQLIALRIDPFLLEKLRDIAAKREKPYQTLIHELFGPLNLRRDFVRRIPAGNDIAYVAEYEEARGWSFSDANGNPCLLTVFIRGIRPPVALSLRKRNENKTPGRTF